MLFSGMVFISSLVKIDRLVQKLKCRRARRQRSQKHTFFLCLEGKRAKKLVFLKWHNVELCLGRKILACRRKYQLLKSACVWRNENIGMQKEVSAAEKRLCMAQWKYWHAEESISCWKAFVWGAMKIFQNKARYKHVLLLWLTLTEVFPCFFLSCKANARV